MWLSKRMERAAEIILRVIRWMVGGTDAAGGQRDEETEPKRQKERGSKEEKVQECQWSFLAKSTISEKASE